MVICKICGDEKVRLGSHVRMKHGMSMGEYNLWVEQHKTGETVGSEPVKQPNRVGYEVTTAPTLTVKHKVSDPTVNELIIIMKDQQAIELEKYKLESIKDMRSDLKTPKSERSGGILDKFIGTVMPPLMNKFVDVDSGIKQIQENMDVIAQQVPEEKQDDFMGYLKGLMQIVGDNPDIIKNLFKQFMPK